MLDIVALAVSVIALLAGFYQAKLTRDHNHLTVMPSLELYYSESSEGDPIRLAIEHNGAGPAVVYGYRVTLNDVDVPLTEPACETVKRLGVEWPQCNAQGPLFLSVGMPYPGDSLLPDDQFTALAHNPRVFAAMPEALREELRCRIPKQLVVEVSYCSVYGDAWLEGCRTASSRGRSYIPKECGSPGTVHAINERGSG